MKRVRVVYNGSMCCYYQLSTVLKFYTHSKNRFNLADRPFHSNFCLRVGHAFVAETHVHLLGPARRSYRGSGLAFFWALSFIKK